MKEVQLADCRLYFSFPLSLVVLFRFSLVHNTADALPIPAIVGSVLGIVALAASSISICVLCKKCGAKGANSRTGRTCRICCRRGYSKLSSLVRSALTRGGEDHQGEELVQADEEKEEEEDYWQSDQGVSMEPLVDRTQPQTLPKPDVATYKMECAANVAELKRIPRPEDQFAFSCDAEDRAHFSKMQLISALPERVDEIEEIHADFLKSLDSALLHVDRSVGGVGRITRDPSSAWCCKCGNEYGPNQRFAGNCCVCASEGCIGCLSVFELTALGRDGQVQLLCFDCLEPTAVALSAVARGTGRLSRTAVRERNAIIMSQKGMVPYGTGRAITSNDTLSSAAQGVVKCSLCSGAFSVIKSPRSCAKCSQAICSACSDDFYLLGLVSGHWNACFCRVCAVSFVKMLEESGKKNFFLKRPAGAEVRKISLLDRRPPGKAILPPSNPGVSCSQCARDFSLVRGCVLCSLCQGLVCSDRGCVGNAILKSKPEILSLVCRSCSEAVEVERRSSFAFVAPGVPLLERLEPEPQCAICKFNFSLIRRRQECFRCQRVICGSCHDPSFLSPALGITSLSPCCKLCILAVKEELLDLVNSDPRKRVEAASELKTIELFLGMPKSSAVLQIEELRKGENNFCSICDTLFTPATPAVTCQGCSRFVCPKCRDKVQYKALGWTTQREICVFCHEAPKEELRDFASTFSDAALVYPSVLRELNSKELLAASVGVLKCSVCSGPFRLDSPPCRCGTCERLCCFSCSFAHAHAPLLLGTRSATSVCRNCWISSVRDKFQKIASERSNLYSSGVVTNQLRLGDQLVGKVAPDPVASMPSVTDLASSQCYVCASPFSLAQFPSACSSCKNIVCNVPECSGKYALPGSKPGALQCLCRFCAASALRLGSDHPTVDCACSQCKNRYGLLRKRVPVCSECGADHCRICSRYVLFETEGASVPRPVCLSCLPFIKTSLRQNKIADQRAKERDLQRVEYALSGPVDISAMVPWSGQEKSDLQNAVVECHVCACGFSKENFAVRCGRCEKICCRSDVTEMPLSALVSGLSSLVCRLCVAAVHGQLVELKRYDSIADACQAELVASAAWLAAPKEDPLPIEFASCALCAQGFSALNAPGQCIKCSNFVCLLSGSCGGLLNVPSHGASPSFVCRTCVIAVDFSTPAPSALGGLSIGMAPRGASDLAFLGMAPDGTASTVRQKSCGVCQKNFSLIRRAKTCAHCEREVCPSCSELMKMEDRGWAQPRVICNTCATTLSEICPICKLGFSSERPYSYCGACDRSICGPCSLERPKIEALGWQSSDSRVCTDCSPSLTKELDRLLHAANEDAGPGPMARKSFTPQEETAVALGALKCGVCSFPFNCLRSASKCTSCKSAVCGSCSRGNRVSSIWTRANPGMSLTRSFFHIICLTVCSPTTFKILHVAKIVGMSNVFAWNKWCERNLICAQQWNGR